MLARDEIVVVVAAGHRWARRSSLAPAELLTDAFVSREEGSGTRRVADDALRGAGVELEPALQAASSQSLKRMVAEGGFTLLSRRTIEAEQAAGTLRAVPVDGVDLARDLRAVIAAARASPPVRRLWRWLEALADPCALARRRGTDASSAAPATGAPSWSTSQTRSRRRSRPGSASGSPSSDQEVGDPARLHGARALAEAERRRARRRSPRPAHPSRATRGAPSARARARCRRTALQSWPSAIFTPAPCAAAQREVGLLEVVLRELDQQRAPGLGAGAPSRVEPGDAVEARERRHEHLSLLGHALEQVGPLVEVHPVLDRVDAGVDRELECPGSPSACAATR